MNKAAQKSWDSFCIEGAKGIIFENMPLDQFKIAYSGTLSMIDMENYLDREALLTAIWRFGVITEAQGHETELLRKEYHCHFNGANRLQRWIRKARCFLNLHHWSPEWNDETGYVDFECNWCGAVKTHDRNTGHSQIQYKSA